MENLENQKDEIKKPWKSWSFFILLFLIVVGVLFYFLRVDRFFVIPKNPLSFGAGANDARNDSLAELLKGTKIQFGQISQRTDVSSTSALSAELTTFIDLQKAPKTGAQILTYQDGSPGFYFQYSSGPSTADRMYAAAESSAESKGWKKIYGATNSKAAVLEMQYLLKNAVYQARVTYENAINNSVAVTIQYQVSLQK
jgi:hypothetical protein